MTPSEILSVWLKETRTTKVALARRMGVTDVSVYSWAKGKTTPNAANLVRLEEITGIPVRTWLEPACPVNAGTAGDDRSR